MRYLKNLYLLILMFISIDSIAQNDTAAIKGIVKDSINNSIVEGASIVLYNLSDTSIRQQKPSSKNGFIFNKVVTGKYLLVISSNSYLKDSTYLIVKGREIYLTVKVHPFFQNMEEVVITSKAPPIKISGDTMSFNASAFPVPPRSNVEDLLKQLPGLQIDKDGNITLNGQKVDKIKIDGKDIFLGDIKTPSQMLPADIVQQVETYDTHSEQSDWTGIKDHTQRKTINLKLKANRKTGVFGTAYAGAALENRYSAGATINRMSPDKFFMSSLGANNINNQFTGKENIGSAGMGGGGGGIQTSKNFNLNYRSSFGKKITATINGRYFENSSVRNTISEKTTYLIDSTLLENRNSNSNSDTKNFNFTPYLEYKIDNLHEITYSGNITSTQSNSTNTDTTTVQTKNLSKNYFSSLGKTNNTSESNGLNISNTLNYKQRFKKPGRTIFLNLIQSSSQQHSPTLQYSLLNIFDLTGTNQGNDVQNRKFNQTNNGNNFNATFSYTEPITKSQQLSINYGIGFTNNHSGNKGFQFDSSTMAYTKADSLNNNQFYNSNNSQNIGTYYNIQNTKTQYQFGLALNSTDQKNINYTLNDTIQQKFINWLPSANVNFTLPGQSVLNINYSGTTISPTTDMMKPVPDLSNPLLIKLGNPDLKQGMSHNMNLAFNKVNTQNFSSITIFMGGSFSANKISMSTTLLPGGVQQQEYVNVNGAFNITSNITYSFPSGKMSESAVNLQGDTQLGTAGINPALPGKGNTMPKLERKKLTASISLMNSYVQDAIPLNGQINFTRNILLGGNLSLHYNPSEKLFSNFTAMLNYNNAKGKDNSSQDRNSLMQNYLLDFTYKLPFNFRVSSNFNLQVTGAQTQTPSNTVGIWNASISKNVFGKHGGQIKLSAFDILNRSTNFSQTLTSNYLLTSKTNLPGKLYLLSFIYDFRKFPVSKSKVPPSSGPNSIGIKPAGS